MQQEIKQLRHQIKLLTQANKAIFMSDLMRKAVCASKTWWHCEKHQEARAIHCKLSQANKITFVSRLEAKKACFTVQCYWIKHLLGVVTLSERLPLRKFLAPANFTWPYFHEEYGHIKGCTHTWSSVWTVLACESCSGKPTAQEPCCQSLRLWPSAQGKQHICSQRHSVGCKVNKPLPSCRKLRNGSNHQVIPKAISVDPWCKRFRDLSTRNHIRLLKATYM